jgi:hypothetical protein
MERVFKSKNLDERFSRKMENKRRWTVWIISGSLKIMKQYKFPFQNKRMTQDD